MKTDPWYRLTKNFIPPKWLKTTDFQSFLRKNFRKFALTIFMICLGIILIGLLVGFISLFSACQRSASQSYESELFTIEYPAAWQLMSELWPDYQPKDDYYHLGLKEIITLTSVHKQGEDGMWFAVASTRIPDGLSLEALFQQTYTPLSEEIVDITEESQIVNGKTGMVIQYRRPWGEPWWEFRDIWLEEDGTAYVLSFHAIKLDGYQEAIDQILAGFAFK